MDQQEDDREMGLRRAAERRGLLLVKSRDRDPGAIGYGLYVLVPDIPENRQPHYGGQAAIDVFGKRGGITLDPVEAELNRPPDLDHPAAAATS